MLRIKSHLLSNVIRVKGSFVTQAETETLILQAIVELNKQLGPEDKIAPASDTILVGDGGKLDSLALITLMVAIEEACAEKRANARPSGWVDE